MEKRASAFIIKSVVKTPKIDGKIDRSALRSRRFRTPKEKEIEITPAVPLAPDAVALSSLAAGISGWLQSCELRRMSDKTVHDRRWLMEKLTWYLQHQRPDARAPFDRFSAEGFLAYAGETPAPGAARWGNQTGSVNARRATRPVSVHSYFRCLRTLCNYLVSEGYCMVSPLARVKAPVKRQDQPSPFTNAQVQNILQAARAHSSSPARDSAIILLLLDTGLRAGELCSLRVRDISIADRRAVVTGKGNKRRAVFWGAQTARALVEYDKQVSERQQAEPFFFSERGTDAGATLTVSGLRQIVLRLCRAAGIEGARCSPHTLRHTFAVSMLQGGANAFTLQTAMGHTSLATTNGYVQIASADLENHARASSPVDNLLRGGKERRRGG